MKKLLTGRAANLAMLDQGFPYAALHELTPGFREPHSDPIVRKQIEKNFKKNKKRRQIANKSRSLNRRRGK